MKTSTLIVSLLTAFCLLGCSKTGKSASGLVPATAAEVAASSDFKLEHTTKSGVKCYVREITPQVAATITEKSPDHKYLNAEGDKPSLLVVVHNNKIIDLEADDNGLTTDQEMEIVAWAMKKAFSEDPEMQKMLKAADKKK